MNPKFYLWLLTAFLLVSPQLAEPQQPKKLPRIGFLSGQSLSNSPVRREAFQQGLRELGYVEGKNIFIQWRYAEGKFDRLPALAAELVSLKVDIIVTGGPQATRPAKQATSTIPIVMARTLILLETGSSPALRNLTGTLQGFPALPRS